MIAEVIVEITSSNVDKVFDYSIPQFAMETFSTLVGRRVLVPFGNRKIEGYIINIKEQSNLESSKIKEIIKFLDENPVILPEMLKLMQFMVEEYNLKKVDVLRLFIPSEMRGEKIKPLYVNAYQKVENFDLDNFVCKKNAKKQQEIVDFLKNNEIIEAEQVKNFSDSAIKSLVNLGVIKKIPQEKYRTPKSNLNIENSEITLNNYQQKAVDGIKGQGTYLLHGVTGSGKTEVYMHLIERILKENKTAIMLVPEISLTPQVLQNFTERFGENVAILHSGLSAGERFDEWRRLLSGNAKIAVGARSCIFAPLQNVGIIIIDEEHDGSYISESNPRYNTIEIAKFRSTQNNCPLVLGSATPSLDSYSKVMSGEYKLFELPIRANGKPMPEIQIVDMLNEIRNGNTNMFSRSLLVNLEECVKEKNQAMIFINRRGFSSFMMCRECGYVAKCTDCDVSLVYHKAENKLKCHYCGKRFHVLDVCPQCGSKSIKQGAVGTEQVVLELKKYFPNVPIFRMDNDTTRNKNAHEKILSEFRQTKPSILVGTQMIAKGHDIPNVTLVGIVDADQSLYQSHYKSAERTFALITQVSGRAGRSEKVGRVILQTYNPKHYVYRFAKLYDYKGFFDKEVNLRKTTGFPPYSTIIRLLISADSEEIAYEKTKNIIQKVRGLRETDRTNFMYLDAMKSPVARVKNKFRYQVLMRVINWQKIRKQIYELCDNEKDAKISLFVEINPQNLS
ncbi:MAG: primosomal protein N' [Firmicutes bacterium]|nr:primosomal protein N' [Bacillota bacterium]